MNTKSKSSTKDAITMLMDDHKRVKELFDEFRKFEAAQVRGYARGYDSAAHKQELMDAVCAELKVHTRIEEEIFYPATRAVLGDSEDLMNEAEVEHATAKTLIAQIENSDAGDPLTCARVKVLGDYIEHHVNEEETELFPRIRASSLDLIALGASIARRKEELVFELAEQQFSKPEVPRGPSLWSKLMSANWMPARVRAAATA